MFEIMWKYNCFFHKSGLKSEQAHMLSKCIKKKYIFPCNFFVEKWVLTRPEFNRLKFLWKRRFLLLNRDWIGAVTREPFMQKRPGSLQFCATSKLTNRTDGRIVRKLKTMSKAATSWFGKTTQLCNHLRLCYQSKIWRQRGVWQTVFSSNGNKANTWASW